MMDHIVITDVTIDSGTVTIRGVPLQRAFSGELPPMPVLHPLYLRLVSPPPPSSPPLRRTVRSGLVGNRRSALAASRPAGWNTLTLKVLSIMGRIMCFLYYCIRCTMDVSDPEAGTNLYEGCLGV